MLNKQILAVGLNPAKQQILRFESLTKGAVNRAYRMDTFSAGKAVNFARAANIVKPDICRVVTLFGGDSGQHLMDTLDHEGIAYCDCRVAAPTRTCTTLLCDESGQTTEVIEPSGIISEDEYHMMLDAVSTLKDVEFVACCGTFPPGIPESFYADIVRLFPDSRFLIDTSSSVDEVLGTGRVEVLKINNHELCAILREEDVRTAAEKAIDQYPLSWLAITAGADDALLFSRTEKWIYQLPQLKSIVNPIGAGDACSAVTTTKLSDGCSMKEAFGWGLAAASASCLELCPAKFDTDKMFEIHSRLKITAL